jgi:hypothetical protein
MSVAAISPVDVEVERNVCCHHLAGCPNKVCGSIMEICGKGWFVSERLGVYVGLCPDHAWDVDAREQVQRAQHGLGPAKKP